MVSYDRPGIGVPVLLVYRECPCGEWCATGEGSVPPMCSRCGEAMWPLGTQVSEDGVPRFGADEQRRLRGLGFLAVLTNEIAAAQLLGRGLRALGFSQAALAHDSGSRRPYAADGEVGPRSGWRAGC